MFPIVSKRDFLGAGRRLAGHIASETGARRQEPVTVLIASEHSGDGPLTPQDSIEQIRIMTSQSPGCGHSKHLSLKLVKKHGVSI